jgi:hypothetical protein
MEKWKEKNGKMERWKKRLGIKLKSTNGTHIEWCVLTDVGWVAVVELEVPRVIIAIFRRGPIAIVIKTFDL